MIMDRSVAYRLDVANATGMRADSFSIIDGDTEIQEEFPDVNSRLLHDLGTEFMALAELGDKVPCTFTDAQDFTCMFEDLMQAETVEDFEAIAGCYGNLAQRPGVKRYIEYHVSKLRSA